MTEQMALINKRLELIDHNYNLIMQQQVPTGFSPFRHNQHPLLVHGPPAYPQPQAQQVPQTILQRPLQTLQTSQ